MKNKLKAIACNAYVSSQPIPPNFLLKCIHNPIIPNKAIYPLQETDSSLYTLFTFYVKM